MAYKNPHPGEKHNPLKQATDALAQEVDESKTISDLKAVLKKMLERL